MDGYAQQFKLSNGRYDTDLEYYNQLGGINDDDGHDLAEFYTMEVFKFGATVGDEALLPIRNMLNHFNQGSYNWPPKLYDESVCYLITGVIETHQLIDYGTSVRGAWLTEKGKQFLSDLNTLQF